MPKPSLRLFLPLLVLVFTAVAALISFGYHSSIAARAVADRALSFVRRDISSIQRQIEYLSGHGEEERIQALIGPFGEHPNLRLVLALDDHGRVLGSLHRWQTGMRLADIEPHLDAGVRDLLERRFADGTDTVRTSDIHLSPSSDLIRAVFPLTLPAGAGEIRPSRHGSLVAVYDIGPEKSAARAAVWRQTLGFMLMLFGLAAVTGVILHFSVNRRLARILRTVQRFTQGDLSARTGLRGGDELAELGKALDRAGVVAARTQTTLRQSQSNLSEAQRLAHLGSWEIEVGADTFTCSAEARRLFGYAPEGDSLPVADVTARVHPDDREPFLETLDTVVSGNIDARFIEYRVVLPDGRISWLQSRWRPLYDEHGNIHRVAGTTLDVTRAKLNQLALEEARERAQVTLDSIGDAVITTDAQGCVEYLNPVAETLTGWSTEEAAGLPLGQVFEIVNEETGEPAVSPVHSCLREGRTVGLANHTVLISRSGRHIAIEDSAAPIRSSAGAILGVVMVFHDVTEKRRLTNELHWQASHDPLTGLYNRYEFERRLGDALDDAKANDAEHAVIYFDLDQFKVVNDTCGHMAGDELLRQLPVVLQQTLRSTDTLARLGGDEFALIVQHCSIETATGVAEKLMAAIRGFRFAWENQTFDIGASFGVVPLDNTTSGITQLLTAADLACYTAKDRGRGRIHVYQHDDAELVRRHGELQQVTRINHALDEDRFVLHAQPILPCRGGNLVLHELLVRMVDESGTLLPPGAFIPAAERYDLMPAVDRWIIRHFFAFYGDTLRRAAGTGRSIYSINLSGASLSESSFQRFVVDTMEKHDIPPQSLCFEITETAAVANLAQTRDFIAELQSRGCRFALDDFGSGVSSFAYLKNLPVDFLKIDGAFVRDMLSEPIDRALVTSINNIGHELGMLTIAEFVENEAVLDALTEIGVDFAQGFGVARPEPLSELESLGQETG